MTNLTPGKRYRVTFEGVADAIGWLDCDGEWGYLDRRELDAATSVEQLRDPAPAWQLGDVVAWDSEASPRVRYTAMLVRTDGNLDAPHIWRSAAGGVATDSFINNLWDAGRLELVARNGHPWPKKDTQ